MPKLILRAPEVGEWGASSEAPDLIRIPLSLDLSLHAVPGTALILDFFLFEKKYPKSQARRGGAIVAIAASLWYSCWVEHCASYNGVCKPIHLLSATMYIDFEYSTPVPYPFLTFNPLPIRAAIYAGTTVFAYTVFQLLNKIHS